MEKNIWWGNGLHQMILLALPVLAAHVIEALIPFINVMLISSVGETSLAAAALVGSTFMAFMGFCWGVIASVGIMTANRIGEGASREKTGLVLWSGFATTLFLSIPVMIIFANMSCIWILTGQDALVISEARHYMSGLLLAVPADLAKFAIFQFAIAYGRPRVPLIANIASIPLLCLINYGLIRHFGIYGIGLGTAITYFSIFLLMLGYLLMNGQFRQSLLPGTGLRIREGLKTCYEQLRLGVPIGLMFSVELIFFMVLTLMVGHLGARMLAANQIVMQWMWLTVMCVYGFTEAATILVAKANGAKNISAIRQFTHIGMVLAAGSSLVVAGVYLIFPGWIIQVDSAGWDSSFMRLTAGLLALCGVYQIADSLRIILAGALRGIEDTVYPLWATLFAFWGMGLPVCYLAAFSLDMKATGIWIGLITAAVTGIVIQYYRFYKKTAAGVTQFSDQNDGVSPYASTTVEGKL